MIKISLTQLLFLVQFYYSRLLTFFLSSKTEGGYSVLACNYKVVISMTTVLLTKKTSILLTKNIKEKYVKLVASATRPNDGTSNYYLQPSSLISSEKNI